MVQEQKRHCVAVSKKVKIFFFLKKKLSEIRYFTCCCKGDAILLLLLLTLMLLLLIANLLTRAAASLKSTGIVFCIYVIVKVANKENEKISSKLQNTSQKRCSSSRQALNRVVVWQAATVLHATKKKTNEQNMKWWIRKKFTCCCLRCDFNSRDVRWTFKKMKIRFQLRFPYVVFFSDYQFELCLNLENKIRKISKTNKQQNRNRKSKINLSFFRRLRSWIGRSSTFELRLCIRCCCRWWWW